MGRRGLLLILCVVLALSLEACAGAPAPPAPPAIVNTPEGGMTTLLQSTPAQTAMAPGRGTAGLTSYTLQIESKVEVLRPVRSLEGWTIIEKQVRTQPAPGAYQLKVTDQSGEAASEMRMVVVGAEGYVYTPTDQKWLKVPVEAERGVDPVAGQLLDPDALLRSAPSGLLETTAAVNAHEGVDGVDTTHYRLSGEQVRQWLSAQQAGAGELLSGQADFWVANNSGYLKQYQLRATVRDDKGQEVQHDARLLVTGENRPVEIATPPPEQVLAVPGLAETPAPLPTVGAQAGAPEAAMALSQLPAPPQGQPATAEDLTPDSRATVENYRTGTLAQAVYLSAAKGEDILSFYNTEMVRGGWRLIMSTSSKGAGLPFLAMYGKEKLSVQLVVLEGAAAGKSLVILQVVP